MGGIYEPGLEVAVTSIHIPLPVIWSVLQPHLPARRAGKGDWLRVWEEPGAGLGAGPPTPVCSVHTWNTLPSAPPPKEETQPSHVIRFQVQELVKVCTSGPHAAPLVRRFPAPQLSSSLSWIASLWPFSKCLNNLKVNQDKSPNHGLLDLIPSAPHDLSHFTFCSALSSTCPGCLRHLAGSGAPQPHSQHSTWALHSLGLGRPSAGICGTSASEPPGATSTWSLGTAIFGTSAVATWGLLGERSPRARSRPMSGSHPRDFGLPP